MMDNASFSIIGDNADGTQTGIIVPWPLHDSLYFVFSVGQLGGNLYYSVVNMNRNGGLGEVVIKKVLLQNEVCEKLTAVRNCNKRDYWVVTHKFNSDEYQSFMITPTGLDINAVISPTGNFIVNSNGMEFTKTMGYLKNSPDGRLLAAAHFFSDYVELTDFNTTTGIVSNPRTLNARPAGVLPPLEGAYGIEFSHDSRVLYVSSYYGPPNNDTTVLYQFDVTQSSEAAIQSSRTFIYGADWSHNTLTALQLGPDRKIYVAKYGYSLSLINRPEILGTGCQFVSDALFIDDGSSQHHCDFGLPNFIQSYFNDPIIAIGNCQFSNITFSLQNLVGISNVIWDFGDPASGSNNTSTSLNPTHIYSHEGQYEVRAVLFNTNGCGTDTIYKLVHAGEFKVFLGDDTTICQGDTLVLHMKIPNAGNLWSNNSSDTMMVITNAGQYWVRVGLGECTASDTINITVQPLPVFSLGNDTTVCLNQSLALIPSPSFSNVSYLWSSGTTTNSITVNLPGQYWLSLTNNQFGCQYLDTINIQFKTLPNYSLGPDTSLCEGEPLSLTASVPGASNYMWSSGSISPSINVTQPGIYWADVTKDQCTYRDSIAVIFKPLPIVNFGKDTTLCEDHSLLLDAGNPGALYLWQNMTTAQQFSVTFPGQYFVKVTKDGCSTDDTIRVQYDLRPAFTLGPDFGICDGQSILLQPAIQSSSSVQYLWQNGSSASTFAVSQSGRYSLDVSNYCGTRSDDINVTKGVCKLYVPSAFTPNADGLNDIFKAEYGENVTEFRLEIYNRWGQKIFQTKKINAGWDGRYNGVLQPAGVYIWLIHYKELNNSNQNLLKGTLTLIR